MKKFSIVIVVILAVALLCSCQDGTAALATVSQLASKSYSTVSLSGSVTTGGKSFDFAANATTDQDGTCNVSYSYQELGTFQQGADGNIVIPDSFVVTRSGKFSVKDGVTTDESGNQVSTSGIATLLVDDFTFRADYFDIVDFATAGTLSAHVKSGNEDLFMGTDDFNGTDLSVTVAYTEQRIQSITLDYVTDTGIVTATFIFGE